MAANSNAPYYQVHGQFTPGRANAAFSPADDGHGYVMGAPLPPALQMHHAGSDICTDTLPPPDDDGHDNFAELMKAANSAAGQAAAAAAAAMAGKEARGSKRKRASSGAMPSASAASPAADAMTPPAYKRFCTEVSTDPRLHDGQASPLAEPFSPEPSRIPSSESLLQGARAAGVHSAAALFRRPNKEPARKYTRPPMSKLFMSLQLTPENFLQLQARAKSYMLDPAYPERQTCVGNRGKGDTDMVKLKLFNCVRDFLSGGIGEQFFGEHVEKRPEAETIEAARALGEEKALVEEVLVWPRDGNKIIGFVTPLLRRMVTNERQRKYALETRKGGTRKKEDGAGATQAESASHMHVDTAGSTPPVASVAAYPDSHSITTPAHLQQLQLQAETQTSPVAMGHRHPRRVHPSDDESAPLLSNLQRPGSSTPPTARPAPPKARPLPTWADRKFDLRKIDIFLSRNDLRLKPWTRIKGPEPLAKFSWVKLHEHITLLLREALEMYPDLRTVKASPPREAAGMGPEALRGLAVAASKIGHVEAGAHAGALGSASKSYIPVFGSDAGEPALAWSSSSASSGLTLQPAQSCLANEMAKGASSSTLGFGSHQAGVAITGNRSMDTAVDLSTFDAATTTTAAAEPVDAFASSGDEPEPGPETELDPERLENVLHTLPTPSPALDAPHSRSFLPTTSSLPNPVDKLALQPLKRALDAAVDRRPAHNGEDRHEWLLPKYRVIVMRREGLFEVKDSRDWEEVLGEVPYEVWANGKATIVVEVD